MDLKLKDNPHNYQVNRLPPVSSGLTRDVNVCHPGGLYYQRTIDLGYMQPPGVNDPSWKLEKYFSPIVLTGNWTENRLSWNRDQAEKAICQRPKTSSYLPDRQKALQNKQRNNTGVGDDLITNYSEIYDNNQITMYDEDYNQRWRDKNLPTLRTWNFTHDAWIPEKSDHPYFGAPTQFGLLKALRKKWVKNLRDDEDTYNTIYRLDFTKYPPEKFVRKHATCVAPFARAERRFGNLPCIFPHLTNHQ
ncbi:uncharacterized protein C1orf158 homolog [Octopus sinensis]|uniref:Uncharacterized protein C1orf158 homolog n=1 Tax=Octopus sinensis TaxID=2607531 RepID=A0A6P7SCX8_9MOLL|nr:uncharacterized protein C1orf158 homolog [Octopus sinensis]